MKYDYHKTISVQGQEFEISACADGLTTQVGGDSVTANSLPMLSLYINDELYRTEPLDAWKESHKTEVINTTAWYAFNRVALEKVTVLAAAGPKRFTRNTLALVTRADGKKKKIHTSYLYLASDEEAAEYNEIGEDLLRLQKASDALGVTLYEAAQAAADQIDTAVVHYDDEANLWSVSIDGLGIFPIISPSDADLVAMIKVSAQTYPYVISSDERVERLSSASDKDMHLYARIYKTKKSAQLALDLINAQEEVYRLIKEWRSYHPYTFH